MELYDLLEGDPQHLVDALSFMVAEKDVVSIRALRDVFPDYMPHRKVFPEHDQRKELVNQALICVRSQKAFQTQCQLFLNPAN